MRWYNDKRNGKIISVVVGMNTPTGEVHVTVRRYYEGWRDDGGNFATYSNFVDDDHAGRLLRRGQALQQALLARTQGG